MPDADLYLEAIDYEGYLDARDCARCGATSCRALVETLRASGGAYAALNRLGESKAHAVAATLAIERNPPAVPAITTPRPIPPELAALNDPSPGDPVLVTGNSAFTQEVLLAVLATTTRPFFVLFTDTRGDTLDMAVILESFTAGRVVSSFEAGRLAERARGSTLVLPGLAAGSRDEIAAATGRPVQVGPVCAAELPLYFGATWFATGGDPMDQRGRC
jgi:CO dehydrogenase/acetyl-CoA synthase gamma subunit (corrinoid Fe-S protein)